MLAWAAALVVAAAPSPAALVEDLGRLERELRVSEATSRRLGEQAEALVLKTATLETDLAAARVRHDEAFAAYRSRVRALSRMPAAARLLLLGKAGSIADYLGATRVLRRVAEHDRKVQERWAQEQAALQAAERSLAAERRELEVALAKQRDGRAEVAGKRRERLEALRRVLEDPAAKGKARDALLEARRVLAAMAGKLETRGDAALARSRGQLPWPVEGTVRTRFGQSAETRFGTLTQEQGVTITARGGDLVQAIAAGRVVHTGWLRGYGNLVVLDHGGGYHTLVAGLEAALAEVGAEVAAGAVLGRVAEADGVGASLYFEVRERGVAVDPEKWLRR